MMNIDNNITKKLASQVIQDVASLGGVVPTKMYLSENKEGYLLKVHAPSVDAESYKVEIRHGHLIISSFVNVEERGDFPRFVQAFPILPHVDAQGIEARYVGGELHVFAPFKMTGTDNRNRDIDIL